MTALTYNGNFQRELEQTLRDRQAELKETIAKGLLSPDQYSRECGRLQGLSDALEDIQFVETKLQHQQ